MAGSNVDRTFRGKRLIMSGLIIGGAKPTLAAGAGGDATAAVTLIAGGVDGAGVIQVVAAGAPGAGGVVVAVTFGSPLNQAPKLVDLNPVNAAAAALSGNNNVYVDQASITKTGFNIKVGSGTLAAGTTYQWAFQVIG